MNCQYNGRPFYLKSPEKLIITMPDTMGSCLSQALVNGPRKHNRDKYFAKIRMVQSDGSALRLFTVTEQPGEKFNLFVKDGAFDFTAYDEQTLLLKYLSREDKLLCMVSRLMTPFKLADHHRELFTEYVTKNAKIAAKLAMDWDDAEELAFVLSLKKLAKKDTEELAAYAEEVAAASCTALMEQGVPAVSAAKPIVAETKPAAPAVNDPVQEELLRYIYERATDAQMDACLKEAQIAITKAKPLPQVMYAHSGAPADPAVLKFILWSYMRQMTARPTKIGDYKKTFLRTKFAPDADHVAEKLELTSLQAALKEIAELHNATNFPQRLLPFFRYASEEQLREAMKICLSWSQWDKYSASGRSSIIVCKGAILLNDSKLAAGFAGINGCQDAYAALRRTWFGMLLDEKEFKKMKKTYQISNFM